MTQVRRSRRDARREPQDFAPVLVRDCELSLPIASIEGRRSAGAAHRTANVLVRLHHQPLGSVAVDLPDGALDAAGVADAIWDQLHEPIRAHLAADGLPTVDRLGPGGLPGPDPVGCSSSRTGTEPLVSVVIPTRDRASSLDRCLESLAHLDYPRLEIIVVDNAPTTDDTKRCVERFAGSSITYVREDQAGASAARNRGLREAHGSIIAFTDDDVLVDPRWIRALVDRFKRNPEVACVTGLVVPAELETPAQVWFERYGGFNKGYEAQLYDAGAHRRSNWLYPFAAGTFGSGNNVAFRAELFDRIGGYDCTLGPGTPARAGEDLALFVEVITSGHALAYEPSAVVRHHHRAEYDALRRQLRDYGVGLSAMLTAQSLRGLGRGLRILLCVPVGLRLLLSPSSKKNSQRGGDYPHELAAAELRGFMIGPIAYLRSIRAARERRRTAPSRPVERRPALAEARPPRLRAHFSVPLFRNAYALIATTIITSILGVAYWALAARNYDASDVGRTSAVISALLLVAGIAQLNLVNVLPRFLPAAGAQTRKLVTHAYAVSAAAACAVGVAMVVVAKMSGLLAQAGDVNWLVGVWFVVAAVAWCIFTLQDSVLAGLRQAPWIPVENGLFSSVKILLLLAFASVSQRYGLFLSLTIPVALSLIPVNLFLFRRAIPAVEARAEGRSALPEWRHFRRFVAADYSGGLFQLGWVTILPLIVAARLGLAASAYFYVAWVVATAFDLVLSNIGVSFLVEGAHEGASVSALARSAAKLTAALVLPAVALVIVAAPIALSFLGSDYAEHGTLLLRLLALAALFRAVNVLFLSLARVHRRVRQIVAVQALTCVVGLGLALVLLGPLGLPGAGVAVLIAQATTAVCVAPSLVRDLRSHDEPLVTRHATDAPDSINLAAS
ncbi:MAG: glycosyltransferase [Acidimicrobiia bacterium]